ncbi:MAG TPA: hypothetical protein PK402_14040, partial [Tepidisphaeraceae bacterium]|nr:hypothetical protein [Tepidisphaeraceae bacterium]
DAPLIDALNAPLTVKPNSTHYIENNLILNSVITIGDVNNANNTLNFRGTAGTLSGVGSIQQVGTGVATISNTQTGANQVLMIAAGIKFNLGPKATFTYSTNRKIVNGGHITIDAGGAPSSVTLGSESATNGFSNNGTIEFKNGVQGTIWGINGPINNVIFVGSNTLTLNGAYSVNQELTVPLGTTLFLTGAWTRNASMNIAGSVIFDHGNDNDATYNAIKAAIVSGYNNGTWNGPGLRDPLALTTPNTTLLAAKSASVLGPTGGIYNGVNVDSTAVIVRHTLAADTNLDGVTNFSDLLIVAQQYGQSGVGLSGDLNGDGVVNFVDLLLVAQNYGQTLATEQRETPRLRRLV